MMIVLASDNPAVVDEISTYLRQKGDLFSVAADETLALSAIRADRASLLLIDTTSSAFNGFALCRIVRDDPALSGFPVLCIVEPASLGILLAVLDCNADAFLSRPFSGEELAGAIEDLRGRPSGGEKHGVVRTQFRISHEGRDYTIVADRRQLLEFLLSAFETAVRTRREQEQMRSGFQDNLREMGERLGILTAERDATVTNLHEQLEERGRALAQLNTSLQAKEQAENLLESQKENIARELKELGEVLETIRRSDEERGRKIAALESELAGAAAKKAKAYQEYAATIRELQARTEGAESELGASRSRVAELSATIAGLERDAAARCELEKQAASAAEEHARLAEAESQLAVEREFRIRVQTECDAVAAERERVQEVLEATYRELARVQEEITLLKKEQIQSGQAAAEAAMVKKEIDRLSAELQKEQDSGRLEAQKRQDAEEQHKALKEKYAASQQFLDTASRDIGVLNAALEKERDERIAAEERLRLTLMESADKDRTITALRSELDVARTGTPLNDPSKIPEGKPEVPEDAARMSGTLAVSTPAGPGAPAMPAPDQPVKESTEPAPAPILPPPPAVQMTLPAAEYAARLPPTAHPAGEGSGGEGTRGPEEGSGSPGGDAQSVLQPQQEIGTDYQADTREPVHDMVISRDRWLDITKWAHHTSSVTEEQRKDLIATLMRLSKLVQKGRHLTNRQEQEIRALVARVQALGYRFV